MHLDTGTKRVPWAVRPFERFDFSTLQDGELTLMTVPSLGDPKAVMQVADFRDAEALSLTKAERWIGMSHRRGLRLGKGPLRMVDGVWTCVEDVEAQKGREDLQLSLDMLSLEVIK